MDRIPVEEWLEPVAFTPGAQGGDALARYWLRQVTLRLRREICWLWSEQGLQQAVGEEAAARPDFADRTLVALDLARYARKKREFFDNDVTARYLSERIALPPPLPSACARGSFGWVTETLRLQPVECFLLALALLPCLDSASSHVIATCNGDAQRGDPTLALAQRLWDEPDAVVRELGPAHVLARHGLLARVAGPGHALWQAPMAVAPLVARELLFPSCALPDALEGVDALSPPAAAAMLSARVSASLRTSSSSPRLRIVPLAGAAGAPLAQWLAACTATSDIATVRPAPGCAREHLPQLLTVAWLRGHALYLPGKWLGMASDAVAGHEAGSDATPLASLPLTVFIGLQDQAEAATAVGTTTVTALAAMVDRGAEVLPAITFPPASYAERLAYWRAAVPSMARHPALAEVARRFRYEHAGIARVGAELASLGHAPTGEALFAAARADLDMGTLAQPVVPRFDLGELMLPPAQARQIDEIVVAMRNLTRVHYEWGTARAWNDGGLAVLFSGPPGTGKTMCAEALAKTLELPLYRIDLSQVVNKYIGETEKNLRRLFDAADTSDVMLFFDEADALFGRRTEVRDAHDRFANLEISYLLERMERFKGLAILATNRRKDLDEAFLRRLRFAVDFPLPGPEERLRIWHSVIPPDVDASALDFDFLMRRFALAGGHIRAIVFHACLQSAAEGAPRTLTMPAVIRAVQREYDKLERASSLDQYGPYAPLVAAERSLR